MPAYPRLPSLALGPAIALDARAHIVALQARRFPETAQVARAWLRLAARRAKAFPFPTLSARITALEQGIL